MPAHVRALVGLQVFAAAAILLFWVSFWFERLTLPAAVVDFEWNFPLPDVAWLVPLLLIGARLLRAGDSRGAIVSAAAAGALVFLGLLDAAFNLRAGLYVPIVGRGGLNLAVNAGCVAGGLGLLSVLTQGAGRRDP